MSRGYFSCYEMVAEDDHAVIYAYRSEDWNLPEDVREGVLSEGSFTIRRDALEEPEVRLKRVRKSRRHKAVVNKVVAHAPDIMGHLRDGGIVVDELCGLDRYEMGLEWLADGDFPSHIYIVLLDIYRRYMLEGKLPRKGALVR